ncbi:MAG: epimerase [Planctomycetota bacterium]|nr:epimerase [Planctomycetota bacterium]
MSNDRREFLQVSLAAGALLASRSLASAKEGPETQAKLKILILGGTGFIGPALVELAQANGHTISLFNRGKTNTELFPEIEKIVGDRDPKKGDGIKGLEDRTWDVVFDDCGYYPRHVAASAELFAKNGVGHLIYVSSISCYAKTDVENADETAELAKLSDPAVEKMGAGGEFYGGLKVLCEEASERAMLKKTTIIRPGYIVGPTDPTDRFTYWPVRVDQGGKVLVPGAPNDPLQIIDVRDLSAFMLRCAEKKTIGVFNACGPKERLPWGDVLAACKKAGSAKDVELKWMSAEKVAQHKDVEFPIWAAYAGESKGFHTISNKRAVAAGMTFRSIDTIVADTLKWWKTLPAYRREKIARQFDPMKEAELLASLGG